MNRRQAIAALALAPLAVAAVRAQSTEPTKAQPVLPTEPLVIVTRDGKQNMFHVEVATTSEQQITGLMFRTSVPPDGGMLFDWGTSRDSDMWMKNTLVPLDMVFIANDGRVHHLAENTVPQSLAVISSGGAVRATLELAAGTTARLGIRVGDQVRAKQFGNMG